MTEDWALVTGGNRGTGAAVVDELLARGLHVIALGRTPTGRPDVVDVFCDLAERASIAEALEAVGAITNELRLVVLNAAVRDFREVASLDQHMKSWERAVAVNLTSTVHLTAGLLRGLRQCGGRIVVMGSHAADRSFEGGVTYSAPKAALRAFVETLLLEERRHGVSATLVSAGAIRNRDFDDSSGKMSTRSVASVVASIGLDFPVDLVVGEIEIRPMRHSAFVREGITRLQDV